MDGGIKMDGKTRKELHSVYKDREIVGGVYLIKNTINNKVLLDATTNIHGSRNRFEFAVKTGSCVYLKLQKDWTEQGRRRFVFEVLEELKKDEAQTDAGFKADIDLLKEMWLEKLSGESFY